MKNQQKMPQRLKSTKIHKVGFKPISNKLEYFGKHIVDSAFKVHQNLGPGLLEKVYEICFCYELKKRGINYVRQIEIPVYYDEIKFDDLPF